MSKKILFLSYDGLTDSLGQAQILPYLTGLSKKGHCITVLSCEKAENFQKNKEIVMQKCLSANIHWEYTHYENKYPVISPSLNSQRLKKKTRQIVKERNIEVLHCRSIIPAGIGYSIAKKSGIKFIFDIRGFWADERVDGKIWNLKNPIFNVVYHYFKWKEKVLFEKADCIVTLTENAKEYIKGHFKTKGNFLVVPCCVDFKHFNMDGIDGRKVEQLKNELKIPKENFVLTYVGSLGARYMLNEMLCFFKELKSIQPKASFLFISKSDTSEIESICQEIDLDRSSIFITSCEYSEIPVYISVGNASVFFIITSFSGKAVSPTKQAEVMSLGLPILANTGLGDTDMILNETGSGLVINEFSTSEYQKQARNLLNFSKEKGEIRESAKQFFTLESGIEKYDSVYKNL
ncbi:MAG: glycosyltransferase [Flavobacteriales bacterium]|nr:glycosyltransferase [Flavobacteriales bacterium]